MHTGQHFDYNMSQQFFDELDIPAPDYNLGISGGSHGEMTGKMLMEIEKVQVKEQPESGSAQGRRYFGEVKAYTNDR